MKRYLVFVFGTYYPEGGMNDCELKTDEHDEALEYATRRVQDFYHVHILDTQTGIVAAVLEE